MRIPGAIRESFLLASYVVDDKFGKLVDQILPKYFDPSDRSAVIGKLT
jgi:hypothetical protein